jgi:hypothetical protein
MSEIIGQRPKRRGRGWIQLLFIIIIATAAYAAYTYFDYVWPRGVQRKALAKLAGTEELINRGCGENDVACKERISRSLNEMRNNVFVQTLKEALSQEEIKKHLLKAHKDGSICFLVGGDQGKAPSEEDLVLWLGEYGSGKFLDDKPLISQARNLYERRYHMPTPFLAQRELLKKLRWRHLPFGQTWRTYTLASRFMEWSALLKGPAPDADPSSEERRVMKSMKKNPVYFIDKNIDRLTALAKRDITLDRLAKVRDAMRRFRNDLRALPIGTDRTKLELGWLASTNDMDPWTKKRWRGPYIENAMLVDLWECPIVGEREPKTGAMKLISYGGDCSAGGEREEEDIALSINTYTPKPTRAEAPAKKIRKRRKRRRIVLP